MNKVMVTNFFGGIRKQATRHAPEILTAIGITGMFTTTVLAVNATPKALRICDDLKRSRDTKPTKLDYVKATWKCYAPAAITGVTSATCLIGANSVNARRNAALATAYNISKTALNEYKEKVVETVGEKKERAIREKVSEQRIKDNPVSNNEVMIVDKGNTLCYDAITGRYFKSDIDKIRKAENIINRRIINEMYVSLNDFYAELGLPDTRIGYELGWNSDDDTLEIQFSSHIADDGTPCLVMDYNVDPKYDYSKFI